MLLLLLMMMMMRRRRRRMDKKHKKKKKGTPQPAAKTRRATARGGTRAAAAAAPACCSAAAAATMSCSHAVFLLSPSPSLCARTSAHDRRRRLRAHLPRRVEVPSSAQHSTAERINIYIYILAERNIYIYIYPSGWAGLREEKTAPLLYYIHHDRY